MFAQNTVRRRYNFLVIGFSHISLSVGNRQMSNELFRREKGKSLARKCEIIIRNAAPSFSIDRQLGREIFFREGYLSFT